MRGHHRGVPTTVPYDAGFFDWLSERDLSAVEPVVDLVVDWIAPRSVLDVGCGPGTWLAAFAKSGVSDFLGVDGDYIKRSQLVIPPDRFQPHDLTLPVHLGRSYDLVISLEVAEHLDASFAPVFVDTLVRHAPVVLFSAAIPDQGGMHHVNEQWPEYWSDLFAARGYDRVDCVRRRVWDAVKYWYAQNSFVYVQRERRHEYPRLPPDDALPLHLVHPGQYQALASRVGDRPAELPGVRAAAVELSRALVRGVRRRLSHTREVDS